MNMQTCLRLLAVTAVLGLVAACERPPMEPRQQGYRGLGMEQVRNPRTLERLWEANQAPEPLAPMPGEGPRASEVYQNVQVLGDLSIPEFTRLMAAITEWVSPEQGCGYCHAGEDLAADSLYTKVVSRRMLEMTRHINSRWQSHVADTGVTCYTCHRGQPVPAAIWFADPGPEQARGPAGNRAGQNAPAASVALASLPYDPFRVFLLDDEDVRVQPVAALPVADGGQSMVATERSYGFMMHISEALGVNCTFCHNTRSFFAWDGSTPKRAVAWHGIRMVRDVNASFLEPLGPEFPRHRLGPLGDAPKAHCGTCHLGVSKPLFGAPMLADYPALGAAER